jgi:septal ring factor EnvC (AmiA/AmiB activator)
VWLAVDYSLTKRENRNLEVRLDQLEANYDAARDRIDEFAEAQQRTEAALERIESENAATAAEIKDAVDQLHLEDVEALAAAGASDAAGDLLNRRYRDLQRVLDAATGGAATGP